MSVAGTDRGTNQSRQESVPLETGDQPPAPWTADFPRLRTQNLTFTSDKEVNKFSGSEGGNQQLFYPMEGTKILVSEILCFSQARWHMSVISELRRWEDHHMFKTSLVSIASCQSQDFMVNSSLKKSNNNSSQKKKTFKNPGFP